MGEKRDSIRYKSIIILFVVILVTSCSAGETKTLSIENADEFKQVMIQKVDSEKSMFNFTSEKASLVSEIIDLVNKKSVKRLKDAEGHFKELKDKTYYSFSFIDEKGEVQGLHPEFTFFILEDGTFFYSDQKRKDKPLSLISTEKHPKVLEDLKAVIDISKL